MPEPMTDFNDRRRYANALRVSSERRIEALTQRLVNGEIDLAAWTENMKAELRRSNLEQFITGQGGTVDNVLRTDYLKLGPELKRQYKYLRKFAAVIEKAAANGSDLGFTVARAKLYARSTQAMFWKSSVPVDLPQVPRDGKTACRTNCKCRLRIRYEHDDNGVLVAVLVFWNLAPAEHCPDCIKLARTWNPLRLPVEGDVQESSLTQAVELMLRESPELAPVEDEIRAMWGMEVIHAR